ncbi:DNA-directed RNA polymerase subunit delta [Cohnella pontilimi]|uniref:Probable DNA-directed RNA polymerase subunit delta n=1 Tax=Cohnella pontilimi TaxID=2564100 RepID=A0A4U0F358_9BACL|nr:DNA-directed RNA polymerase subunit delta [Cohnella pontilimi]TJY38981.1 DNA-directed RNA polymerase subunit delta [Cohnella pontilimi]
MSAEYVLKLDSEKIREMPMVDLAFEVLKASNTPFYYRDLMNEIAKLRGFSEDQINEVIAQLYTEINIDGRFACVGSNVWGLKRWYPVERDSDGVAAGTKGPRIINDDDDDDEDLYGDDEEETFTPEDENFDLFDEDREEIFDEGEESAEVDEEVALEEDEDSDIEEIDEEKDEEALADGDLDDLDGDASDDDEDEDDK